MENKINNPKHKIRSIMLKSLLITLCIFVILGSIVYIFGTDNGGNGNINFSEYYNFSGNILSTQEIYKGINLISEEIKDENAKSSIYALTLKNNKLLSKVILNTSVNLSDINNYSIDIYDYNDDGIKDFTYVNQKTEAGYQYNFYSVDKTGKITCIEDISFTLDDDRASLKIYKTDSGYKVQELSFYYDGYIIPAKVGKYKLDKKTELKLEAISKNSKIAIKEKYNALPRKYKILDTYPERLVNSNTYLKDSTKNECIQVDLDGNGKSEYIVAYVINDVCSIGLFDSLENHLVTLFNGTNDKSISKNIELADLDKDGVMEIILVLDGEIEIHKYSNGFYY